MFSYHKKLIEVALPLDAINAASAREKSIRHGHPSTLHIWWARRPLAAARAVIFAQMVDDPSEYVEELLADPSTRQAAEREYRRRLQAWEGRKLVYEKALAAGMNGASNPEPGTQPALEAVAADLERQRLFRLIEDLVLWENTTNEAVLQPARDEIRRSWRRTCKQNADHPRAKELFDPNKLPAFHDPFAGGGALPLEAQRLGLESYASDLNPVAVLINKAMIEIPPRFAGSPPVNPVACHEEDYWSRKWNGSEGLAEDVLHYGKWVHDQAEKRIGRFYPKAEVTRELAEKRHDLKEYIGEKLTVIAWFFARTVQCPNPACGCNMPLLSSLVLSSKALTEWYLVPDINGKNIRFDVQEHPSPEVKNPKKGYKRGMSGIFECAFCHTITTRDYVAQQAIEKGLGSIQTAVVVEGRNGRVYLPAEASLVPIDIPEIDTYGLENELAPNPRDVWCRNFGLLSPKDLFTPRQLLALTTISELANEVHHLVEKDAMNAGFEDGTQIRMKENDHSKAYADAVTIYLAFSQSRISQYWSNVTSWHSSGEKLQPVFGRQAIPMVWDYAEGNPFSNSTGNYQGSVDWIKKCIQSFPSIGRGIVKPANAAQQTISLEKVVSTDPPYFDNIGYADLSDFFYVWLRRSLQSILPDLFTTLVVPKAEELVALPYRHKNKREAEIFFLNGMSKAMKCLSEQTHPQFPVTIYYAFKQAENQKEGGMVITGWEIFLDAVIHAGFAVTGTWPVRTEMTGRAIERTGTNALASSIVLVCRKRNS